MCDQLYKPDQNSLEKPGSSMDGRRFVVAGVGVGFGVVEGSLVPTATSIAQAPFNPRKEQTSAPSPSNTNQKARIFITGSADGLGHAAAKTLLADGFQVVVHVRSQARLTAVQDLLDRGAIASIADLSDFTQTRDLASQVNKVGQIDAVIHNAGVYSVHSAPSKCCCSVFAHSINPSPQTADLFEQRDAHWRTNNPKWHTGLVARPPAPTRTSSCS
jgi:hypothetical protein